MQSPASHVNICLKLALIAQLAVILSLPICCEGSGDEDSVRKKSMDNLYYAFEKDTGRAGETDTSLMSILDVYSLDPEIFGDPVRIVSEFGDSLTLLPTKRLKALVVTDPTTEMPAGIIMDEISGGRVLTYSCRNSTGQIDDCWARIGRYAEEHGYRCILPGIELFRDFGVESYTDTSIVELIVRIK